MPTDLNQMVRDFFWGPHQSDGRSSGSTYEVLLMSELLTLLVQKNVISRDEATGVCDRARARVKKQ